MEYRTLGKTGLKVSALSLGTVELGMEYGIKEPGKTNLPTRQDAIVLIRYAADRGINLFDTAPGYGMSEEILGEAIGNRRDCYIATKIVVPERNEKNIKHDEFVKIVQDSLENSLRALRRDTIDIVQIHNATAKDLGETDIIPTLLRAQEIGKIRFIGASVYGEEDAFSVANAGCFSMIQVAYSILDQRMEQRAFPHLENLGLGIMNRSSLLKGVLSPRAQWLPEQLGLLRGIVEDIKGVFDVSWDMLPRIAIRFCLASRFVDTVLVGVSDETELDSALNAEAIGRMSDEHMKKIREWAVWDEQLLNPSFWPSG